MWKLSNAAIIALVAAAVLMMSSAKPRASTSREGYMTTIADKHNNPLNIKFSPSNDWLGQDVSRSGTFVHFVDKRHGYRAAFKLLNTYAKNGFNTIRKIVTRWAPPQDNNDTPHYINFVASTTGIPQDQIIGPDDFKKIIAAMARMESGDNDPVSLNAGYALAFQ